MKKVLNNNLTHFRFYADFGSGFQYIGHVSAQSSEDAIEAGKIKYFYEIKYYKELKALPFTRMNNF